MPNEPDENGRQGAKKAVAALYRTLLLREPDPSGLEAYADLVLGGELSLPALVERICRSDEFAANIGKFAAIYGLKGGAGFINDSSQYGEVGLLIREMVNRGSRHRLLVDVGVLGREGSNSWDILRSFAWKGLLIEANPRLLDRIREEFSGLEVEIVSSAVSDFDGRARFYLGANDGVSSLERQAAAGWGPIRDEIEVPVRRLGDLLAEHKVPPDFDLLSLDIEGEDIKVLNDLIDHSPFRPLWVIIEASYDFKTKALSDLPFSKAVIEGYEMVAQTTANLILRRRSGAQNEKARTGKRESGVKTASMAKAASSPTATAYKRERAHRRKTGASRHGSKAGFAP